MSLRQCLPVLGMTLFVETLTFYVQKTAMEVNMDNYQIIISMQQSLYGCALKHTVEIDVFSVGVLKNGTSITINTNPGHHTLSFLSHSKVEKTSLLQSKRNTISQTYLQNLTAGKKSK